MNRKGVTPVVATTLLILIAITASVTAFSFIQDTLDRFQTSAEDDVTEQDRIDNSDIDIEAAWEENDEIRVNIRNTGQYPVTSDTWQVYVDGAPHSDDVELDGEGLEPQETQEVDTGINFPSDEDDPVDFEIQGEYVEASEICMPGGSSC